MRYIDKWLGLMLNRQKGILLLTTICLFFNINDGYAKKRALLIGVGSYENGITLPGVANDIRNMVDALSMMGFQEYDITVLKDAGASLMSIRKTFQSFLIEGTLPEDRVFIYFSGHGSQMKDEDGDEDDGADEVLLPYDVAVKSNTLENVLRDDDFRIMIEKIPAREIFVVLDACHSGTATRNIQNPTDDYVSKFFHYEGMPEKGEGGFSAEDISGDTCIALSACRDNEEALSNKKGSLLTRSILNTIDESLFEGKAVSMNRLRENGERFIAQKLKSGKRSQHPRITGARQLGDINLLVSESPQSLHESLDKAVRNSSIQIPMDAGKRHRIGEEFFISIDIPAEGYLNVFSMDNDAREAVVLFPNRFQPDNKIKGASLIRIPGNSEYSFYATPPAGNTFVWAFMTKTDINAHNEGKTDAEDGFRKLSAETMRELLSEKKDHPQNFGSGQICLETYDKK